MDIIIGHASISEDGTMYGKQIGDQTGLEVCLRTYWSDAWRVIRARDIVMQQRLAQAMRELCENDYCGYNASTKHRNTGIAMIVKYGRISDIREPFSVDCSSAIRLCCRQAGINLPNFTTKSEETTLCSCGYFLPAFDVKDKHDLKEGDILVKPGHTVMVVETECFDTPKAEPKKKVNISSLLRKFKLLG